MVAAVARGLACAGFAHALIDILWCIDRCLADSIDGTLGHGIDVAWQWTMRPSAARQGEAHSEKNGQGDTGWHGARRLLPIASVFKCHWSPS